MKILLVEDNEIDQEAVRRALGGAYQLRIVETVSEARAVLVGDRPRCVLLDQRLPGEDGLALLPYLRRLNIPVIMLTRVGGERFVVQALRMGAQDFFNKENLHPDLLKTTISRAIERHSANELLNLAITSAPHAVLITDPQGHILLSNPAAEQMFDVNASALEGTHIGAVVPQAATPGVLTETTTLHKHSTQGVRSDGSQVELEMQLDPIQDASGAQRYLFTLVDVTETLKLEAQLRHAQKMEAIGTLVGGIAHDFNNILTAMFSFGEFALDGLDPDDPAHGDVDQVLKAATRAEKLIQQLMAFSRRRPAQPKHIDINDLVSSLETMLCRIVGEDVRIKTRLDTSIGHVKMDPNMFEQVVVNLVVNARQAMPQGGLVVLETEALDLDADHPHAHSDNIPPGRYVALKVIDSGVGMDAATQARVFEPFFSTRLEQGGTGLGLATCYGIIKQAGGFITVYSEPSVGATFTLYLPESLLQSAAVMRSSTARITVPGGDERILVVEDSDPIRTLAVRALTERGYSVLAARDGQQATAILTKCGRAIDLLLTDVVMPERNGRAVVASIAERFPGMKVVFMSGYTFEILERNILLAPDVALLTKPFKPRELCALVRDVLDNDGFSVRDALAHD